MKQREGSRKGNAVLEFTFVGIPLMFVMISVFEVARGMWIYHTLAYATTEAARYVIVHGQNSPRTIADVATVIQYAGAGLDPGELQLTFNPSTGTCTTLAQCLADTTVWPPQGANLPGMDVVITATYPFRSAIALFWPGAGGGMVFPAVMFPAASRERIQF